MNNAFRIALLTFAAVSLSPLADAAEDPVTPLAAKGVQVISIEQARDLVGKVPFFDFRSPVNYGRGHIKDAVALPYYQTSAKSEAFDASQDKFDKSRLPKDKALAIVFYSDGTTGWKAYKAAIVAAKGGYSNVKWMREGTAGWVANGGALE